MQEINGLRLLELLNEATKQGANFKIGENSVQGLRGIYVEFDTMISYENDVFNIVLIKEIKR